MAQSYYFGPCAAKPKRVWASRTEDGRASGRDCSTVRHTSGKSGLPLEFSYHRVLVGFELNVAWRTRARRLAILGASGSGKSMTLRLIAGLDRSETAVLHLHGRDVSKHPPDLRSIAYVPQTYG